MSRTLSEAEAARLLKLATNASVLVALILIASKLAAYWETESVSILASLIDSLMDAGASLLNLLAVRYALTPADREHRFGHGKAESIAALAQATFIFGSAVFLMVESVQRLINPRPLEHIGTGLIVMIFATVATAGLVALQHYVIRRTKSQAIKADSLHYLTDLLTNGVIILALLLSQLGWIGVDPLFAMGIALYILWSASRIMREALDDLLDRELPDETRERIIEIASKHPKVLGVHDLRTRMSGRIEFVQMHLELDPNMPLLRAHRISDEVAHAIMGEMPTADVVIHQDPAGIDEVQLDQQIEQ